MKQAIVLAGGFGTRLQSIVVDKPKPMAPINGRPFLAILLERLVMQGIQRVVLSVGYKAIDIVNYFGSSFGGIEIQYEIETQPLGTGGATRASLARCTDDPVLILNGDTFLDLDMVALDAIWGRYKAPLIVAREVEDTARYGRLRTCDGRVVGFEEKACGGAGLINAGIYVFPLSLLEAFPDSSSFALERDFLAQQVQHREFRLHVSSGYFIDIGIPEDYERAQRELPRLMP